MLIPLALGTSAWGQCEEEARLLRIAESGHQLAMARHQQADAAVTQYEALAELLVSARETRDVAAQSLSDADTLLTSSQEAFTGCEEEAARLKEEEERILLESIPKLALSIVYFGPVDSVALSREEARRFAAAMEGSEQSVTVTTTPIEVSVPAVAGFTYELFQSSDLVNWQSQSTAAYLAEDKVLTWQVTPTTRTRAAADDGKERDSGATDIGLHFRLSIEPEDTTQGGGRVRGRS